MPPDDADDARRLIEETARASAEAVARRLAETRLGPDQQRHTGLTVAETVAGFLADAERRLARGEVSAGHAGRQSPGPVRAGRRVRTDGRSGPGWQWVWRPGS